MKGSKDGDDKMRRLFKRKRNRGFTLVEVLVAAAILSLVVTPILSSFVAIARVNAKSRRRLSATTIANSVMESVKGFDLSEVSKQFHGASNFHIVALTVNTVSEVGDSSCSEGVFTPKDSGEYEFRITGVQMDGTKYDVQLKYKINVSRTREATSISYDDNGETKYKSTTEILGEMGVRTLIYYDVEVNVYRGETGFSSTPLATLTGSKADYTMAPQTED